LGLHSAYHDKTLEVFGKETRSTLYQYRDQTKTYHIDYCFVHRSLAVAHVRVLDFNTWCKLSDHVPVVVDVTA
jgi:endonuclease/exonuclease/phosphatase family metal-dependent hydrolase